MVYQQPAHYETWGFSEPPEPPERPIPEKKLGGKQVVLQSQSSRKLRACPRDYQKLNTTKCFIFQSHPDVHFESLVNKYSAQTRLRKS